MTVVLDRPTVAVGLEDPADVIDIAMLERNSRTIHRVYDGKPLNEAQIKSAVDGYVEFLRKHQKLRATSVQFAPSDHEDRVFHAHMCNPGIYAADCQRIFGALFIHAVDHCNGSS